MHESLRGRGLGAAGPWGRRPARAAVPTVPFRLRFPAVPESASRTTIQFSNFGAAHLSLSPEYVFPSHSHMLDVTYRCKTEERDKVQLYLAS